MNTFGILIGLVTLFIIGLGFPLVILGERYFGYLWWPYMMCCGFLLIAISFSIRSEWLSILAGVLGATFVWGSTELKGQSVRAQAGWFPNHPHKLKPPFEWIVKRWKAPHL